MPYLEWNDKLLVGIVEIDAQHKKLFAYANELHRHIREGEGNKQIDAAIKAVIDYAKTHFADEESSMKEHQYPGLDAHQKEHRYFITMIASFISRSQSNQLLLVRDILLFLRTWYTSHITRTDRAYGVFLNPPEKNLHNNSDIAK